MPPGSANPNDVETGSPGRGEPVFLVVGRIGRPHGVRGEVSFKVLTDFPERLVAGKTVFVGPDYREMTLAGRRGSLDRMILAFEGVRDRDAAGNLRSQLVHVRTAEVPALPDGEIYVHELIGMAVHTGDAYLGEVVEILATGANDVLVIRTPGGEERLIPAIDQVLVEIDLENDRIRAELLPGL